jgi:NAD(P) transhydrogenase subunit alpha
VKIGTLKEIFEGEQRVALTPESAAQLQKLGHICFIEKKTSYWPGCNLSYL